MRKSSAQRGRWRLQSLPRMACTFLESNKSRRKLITRRQTNWRPYAYCRIALTDLVTKTSFQDAIRSREASSQNSRFSNNKINIVYWTKVQYTDLLFLLMNIGAEKEMARVKPTHRLRSLPFRLALVLVLFTTAVSEADCVEDALGKVDGRILVMASGAVYRVTNTRGVELTFWQSLAAVTICDQVSISGEIYYSISNKDMNETVWAARERGDRIE